jgi:hypothetical protein
MIGFSKYLQILITEHVGTFGLRPEGLILQTNGGKIFGYKEAIEMFRVAARTVGLEVGEGTINFVILVFRFILPWVQTLRKFRSGLAMHLKKRPLMPMGIYSLMPSTSFQICWMNTTADILITLNFKLLTKVASCV